jgi:hypothetical protein
MTTDALDPGPGGDYPHWPRKPDGSTDDKRMPRGARKTRLADGRVVVLDPAPGDADGTYAGPSEPAP